MTIERIVRLVAGTFVTAGAVLSYMHSPYWLLFVGFVGLNLFQSAFTGTCPLMVLLARLGVRTEAEACVKS